MKKAQSYFEVFISHEVDEKGNVVPHITIPHGQTIIDLIDNVRDDARIEIQDLTSSLIGEQHSQRKLEEEEVE